MVKTLSPLLNMNGETEYPCLVPDFSTNDLSCSTFSVLPLFSIAADVN